MKNPLTSNVESSLGAVFISLLTFFFIGLVFIAIKNFNSDIDVMAATDSNNKVSIVSQSERTLIQQWIEANGVQLPAGTGYKYILRKYPGRPWLD